MTVKMDLQVPKLRIVGCSFVVPFYLNFRYFSSDPCTSIVQLRKALLKARKMSGVFYELNYIENIGFSFGGVLKLKRSISS